MLQSRTDACLTCMLLRLVGQVQGHKRCCKAGRNLQRHHFQVPCHFGGGQFPSIAGRCAFIHLTNGISAAPKRFNTSGNIQLDQIEISGIHVTECGGWGLPTYRFPLVQTTPCLLLGGSEGMYPHPMPIIIPNMTSANYVFLLPTHTRPVRRVRMMHVKCFQVER